MHDEIYKEIIESHFDLVIIFSIDFDIIYVNPALCSFFNKKESELIGKSFLPEHNVEERERVKKSLIALNKEDPHIIFKEEIIIDEVMHYLSWTINAIYDDKGNKLRYTGIGQDITSEEIYHRELIKLKERYQLAEIIGKTGNWDYNVQTQEFWGSPGSKSIYGLNPNDEFFTTDDVENCIPNREEVHQNLIDLIEKDKKYDIEFKIHPQDGSPPKIISSKAKLKRDADGKPLLVTGVIHDITDKYKAREELKNKEYHYRNLIEAAPEAVYLISEKGILVDVNETACKKLDKSPEELKGSLISDVDPNFQLDSFLDFWKNVGYNQVNTFESTHKHKDGHLIPVELAGIKYQLDGEDYYYGLARDISQRKEMEEKLKKSEERFKLAVEGTQDGLWDWDLITDEAFHSDRFAEMLGYKPEELPYTVEAWMGLIHPDDQKKAMEKVNDYLSGKTKKYESTFRMKCKEGFYRWITGRGKAIYNEKGEPYRFVGFNTDITKRKNTENSFIKSEEKFHRLYDTMLEGVLFYNENGMVTDANPAAEEILGAPLRKLKGKNSVLNSLKVLSETGEYLRNKDLPISITLREGKVIRNSIMHITNLETNHKAWLSVNTIPIFEGNSEKPAKAYAIFQDITKQRQYLSQLNEKNESLRLAQEIARVGFWKFNVKDKKIIWSDHLQNYFKSQKIQIPKDVDSLGRLLLPQDKDEFLDTIEHLILNGRSYSTVLRIRNYEGEIQYIHSIGHPRYNSENEIVEVYGIAQNLTKITKLENELIKFKKELKKQ